VSYASIEEANYRLAMLLRQAADALLRARQSELQRIGVTTIEAATLLAIDDLGERALPMRISEWILRRPNSTSSLLQRMEQDRLVERAYDLEHRNLVRMQLTDHGREILKKVADRSSVEAVFDALSEDEKGHLETLLLHVRTAALALTGAKVPPVPRLPSINLQPDE
jgi:DNA-binding MarR family transcriptional regulator